MRKDCSPFLFEVRNGNVKQPTQFGFSKSAWKKSFDKFSDNSKQDNDLYLAGLWIGQYLNDIRTELRKFDDKVVDLIKLRRMYVAMINRDYCVADQAIKDFIGSDDAKNTSIGALAEQKLPIGPEGQNVHILGAIESSLSALRFPLSETFNHTDIEKKSVNDLEILRNLQCRLNLAMVYSSVSNKWQDCLWNNWFLESNESIDLIKPPTSIKYLSRIVSEHRFENLGAEFTYHTINMWKLWPTHKKEIEQNKLRIVSIERKGKRKTIKLGKYHDESFIIPDLSMAIAAEEQYWDQLLLMPLPKHPDISIRHLIESWRLFSSLGRTLKNRMPEDTGIDNISKLIQFAQKLKKNVIIDIIKKASGYSLKQVMSIVDMCIFRGDVKEDPWLTPLIPLDGDSFCCLIPSLITTNRIRLIESWMRKGGLDLDKRGGAFEEYVRQELDTDIKSSRYLSNTFFSPESVTLSIEGKEEQIDFIWIVGTLILLGEIKCSLSPSIPLEVYNFYNMLHTASHQIIRKVDFVQNNLLLLYHELNIDAPKDLNDIVVSPILITNLTMGAGFPINGVPVTDLRILTRYLEGYQKFFVQTSFAGDDDSKQIKFYTNTEEAQNNILEYLKFPPTIRLLCKLVDKEIVPFLKFDMCEKNAGWLRFFIDESKLTS